MNPLRNERLHYVEELTEIENYYRYKYNVPKKNKDLYGIRYLKHKGKITDYIFKI